MAKKTSPKTASNAVKPEAKGKATTMAKTAASARPMAKDTSKAIVSYVDPKAIAPKGEGERVTKTLCASAAQINELEQKLSIAKTSKGAALSAMTNLFILAGKTDKRLNFNIANGEDNKAKNVLFNKCRAILGIIDVKIGSDGVEQVTQAPWADELFPRVGETKKKNGSDPDYVGRETNRSNFTARIREACKAAHGVLSTGMNAEIDKTSGLLAVSGKAAREHFNQDRVILNEKQSFKTSDGKDVNLKAKPSITEIGRMGGAKSTRGAAGGNVPATVNPANNEQVAAMIAKWQAVIEKLARFDDTVASALDNLTDAIDAAKERNEKLASAA